MRDRPRAVGSAARCYRRAVKVAREAGDRGPGPPSSAGCRTRTGASPASRRPTTRSTGRWLALARRLLGDHDGSRRALAHVVSRRTSLDLLAEQVGRDGRPAWVLPLGWSHAMLLLAALPELRLVGVLAKESAGDGRGG